MKETRKQGSEWKRREIGQKKLCNGLWLWDLAVYEVTQNNKCGKRPAA